jgi:NTP pyrophosphatase (non-canonical NTP hydrolase)
MSFAKTEMKVIQWVEARRIYPNGKPVSQLLKAMAELGELADAEGKQDREAIIDAVGDVMVCLTSYCLLHDLDLTQCYAHAYEQIKNRKGTLMPDGTFVRDRT